MNDILIKIDTKTAKAYCENNRIGVKHANLQNKLIFEMSEKITGSAWVEYEIDGVKNYALMEETENGYQIDIKSCLLISNNVNVDLKITENENAEGIPIFISTIVELDVYDSINALEEEPEYYPDWKTIADSKIAEMNQLKEEVEEAIDETNNLNIDVSDKVDKEVNITLTKKDNTTKRVTLKDGTSLMFNWDGTRLGIKTDEDEEYTYVDLIGRTGPMGPQGEAFQVKKTYANINLMIADYDNMQINDYVMIDGNIEQEDNAKLFVKQEIEDPTYRWHYLADFSGATGIQGPIGLTPNIQIGTVTSGNTPSVSRTGTNENPILNFVLQQGPQGEIGPTGATGETGNGILNIVKLSSIDNIDTYQINMTDGTYYQFTVTNSNVTNQEFDDLKNRYESLINTLPKVTGTGTNITLNNTSEYYMKSILNPTELTQDGTPTPDNPVDVNVITGDNTITISNSDGTEEQNYSLNLGSLEYCKIGNYADQIFKNTSDSPYYDNTLIENEWYLKKNIGKMILDGRGTWNTNQPVDNKYGFYIADTSVDFNTTDEKKALSNYFNGDIPSNIIGNGVVGVSTRRNTGQGIFFRVPAEVATTVAEWEAWLSTHNVTVYYGLATPQYIHISSTDYPVLREQLDNLYNYIKSYLEQTNITQENEYLPFNIETKALYDLNNLITRLEILESEEE